jgi:hypothetical protein
VTNTASRTTLLPSPENVDYTVCDQNIMDEWLDATIQLVNARFCCPYLLLVPGDVVP